jgi:transposase InsO family protein
VRIRKLLTDNGKEFTDRLFSRDKQVSGQHEFDQLCAALEIEHRLTRPRTPQTNGMVERFNGRIADIVLPGRSLCTKSGASAASILSQGMRVASTAKGCRRSIIWSSRERKNSSLAIAFLAVSLRF